MRWMSPLPAHGEPRFERFVMLCLTLGYPLFYALGFLSWSRTGSAAIWPSHALTFAAFMALPVRRWALVAAAVLLWDTLSRPILLWGSDRAVASWAVTAGFACANILTTAGPASLARAMRLFRFDERFRLVISPLWIVALFAGSVPGALLGCATSALDKGVPLMPGELGLWVLAAVLSIVTFGPMVFGLLLGYPETPPTPARAWEGWALACMVLALFVCFAAVPLRAVDPVLEPMWFAIPLVWLALRFSRRTTDIGVVIVASAVVFFAGHGVGIYRGLANNGWRDVVISIDAFLVIGCGGALLVNLMTLRQRVLLDELAKEHLALRDYARALGVAEDTARRKTAADLHDGIGQILAGQSMTLAAMRAHANDTPFSELLDEATEASREAQEGLRVMIQDLSPPGLDQASLNETLRWPADFFETRFGFGVDWHVIGNTDPPRDRIQLIYRCARELLMNARKHSQCQGAEVEVEVSAAAIEIAVIDEGVGFDPRRADPSPGKRFGLAQLRERVRAAGGTLAVDTVIGEGCRVTVRLPSEP